MRATKGKRKQKFVKSYKEKPRVVGGTLCETPMLALAVDSAQMVKTVGDSSDWSIREQIVKEIGYCRYSEMKRFADHIESVRTLVTKYRRLKTNLIDS